MKNVIKRIFNKFLNILYPKHIKCIFCGNDLNDLNKYDCCENCFNTLPFIKQDFCLRCGSQMSDENQGVCLNCKKNAFQFDYARAIFKYENSVKSIIQKYKYSNALYLTEPLAEFMLTYLSTLNWEFDVITFVPLHPIKEKQRGYNQSKELAKIISKSVNKPILNLVNKTKDTPSQTKLNNLERRKNIKDSFKFSGDNIKDKTILLIDDVFTTGATTNEISKILKEHNATKVYVLTLAHTSLPNNY